MISQPMQNPPPPPPQPITPYQQPYTGGQTYAGFWIRVVARLLDGLIVGLPLAVIFTVLALALGGFAATTSSSDSNTQNTAAGVFSGLTGAFNLNLLARINRELEGGFDLGQYLGIVDLHAAPGGGFAHTIPSASS